MLRRRRSAPGSAKLLAYHRRRQRRLSDCPLLPGNRVELLPGGAEVVAAILRAVDGARSHVHMEYYTLEDVRIGGRSLADALEAAAARGVEVALIWDAVGCGGTPDSLFERFRAAGIQTLEYRSVNPFKRRFDIRMNDRDHRKITVVDGAVAFIGGTNMSRVYETPRSVGRRRNPDKAFWLDCAVRIEGPAVGEAQQLFFRTWTEGEGERHDGRALRGRNGSRSRMPKGGEAVRVAGSAPGEHRPLYNRAMRRAIRAARTRIVLATGYFVPARREWRLLAAAARRGVDVQLLLPGYSDVPAAVHAARALYGPLLRAGVRIHEVRSAMLHAKVATFDGVMAAVGSSNFDWRSVHFNNEVDAFVLGADTTAAVDRMLDAWLRDAEAVTLADWTARSLRERLLERVARLWKRLM